jgi:hypothetical protein
MADFSDDGKKRYLLKKIWDEKKPTMAIIMLVPSEAAGIELDSTTLLVLNNASRLGYGSVSIVNLFSTLGDFKLENVEKSDKDNCDVILQVAKDSDIVVYAAGVGKASNKKFMERQKQILETLKSYEKKLRCLCDKEGNSRFQHPLSPAVRTWYLSEMHIDEIIKVDEQKQKKITSSKNKKKLSSS